ncbi:MAG: hypothetical protein QXQ81_10060 [Candidatus Thorarchaeota archaeon]
MQLLLVLSLPILLFVVSLIVNALVLGFALGAVNGRNREFGTTFVTAIFMALTYLLVIIPILGGCIAIIVQWYIIKSRHAVGWAGAIVAWLISLILIVIIFLVIVFVFLGGLAFLLYFLPTI